MVTPPFRAGMIIMKLLVVQCAALGYDIPRKYPSLEAKTGLRFRQLTPVFPAVTCTAQGTIRTGLTPAEHGVICNGLYDRKSCRTSFWNQSAKLVNGKRIWEDRNIGKTAMIFHQQNLGEKVDFVVSPAPIHKHHGGMIMGCQTKPEDLEKKLVEHIGRPFSLSSYWGPLASRKSTEWIVEATIDIARSEYPDLLFTYLPHLDYCLQKYGPNDDAHVSPEVDFLADSLQKILKAVRPDYDVIVWGDYAITSATTVVYPNRELKKAGFFSTRTVSGGLTYPNLYDSRAFAMCDHQVAHVYVQNKNDLDAVKKLLSQLDGVDLVQTQQEANLDCPEAGDLVMTAKPNAWFAYQWWDSPKEAPDYATHIDIHNKIGFDPCELFWGFPPFVSTSTDCSKVKGTHGRNDLPAAFATTQQLVDFQIPTTHIELAQLIKNSL